MWYIAHLLISNKKVIIPDVWVKDIQEHMEKFINRSINTAQEFLVFYSEKHEALDDDQRPLATFHGKFHFLKDGSQFPVEGCYSARLLKAKGMFYLVFYIFITKIRFFIAYVLVVIGGHICDYSYSN